MSTATYKTLLEKLLFPRNEQGTVFIVEPPENEAERSSGLMAIPPSMFPDSCEIIALPGEEAFLQAIKDRLATNQAKHVFVLSPWFHNKDLSTKLKNQYRRESFEAIVLREILEALPDDTELGILLPQGILREISLLQTRQYLFEHHTIKYVIEHAHSPRHLGIPNVIDQFRLCTLIISRGKNARSPICFIKYDDAAVQYPSGLIKDVVQLASQRTNETQHGYSYNGELSDNYELLHDLYHPDRKQELAALISHFGNVRPLSAVVDYVPTIHRANEGHKLVPREDDPEGQLIPVVSGRSISAAGEFVLEEMKSAIEPARVKNRVLLQPGDICLRSIHRFDVATSFPFIVVIHKDDLPLVADNSVIVMRPKPGIDEDEKGLLHSFLKTDSFYKQLKALEARVNFGKHTLNRVQIPTLGTSLRRALQDLQEAETAHYEWINEARLAQQDLFSIPEDRDASIRILSNTRTVRQRHNAAKAIDDFSTRVKTRYPHPIAYRWTIIETSYPDYEGCKHVLECAEVAIAYLASISLVLAIEQKKRIGCLAKEAEKLGQGKSTGKTFGFWKRLLTEVQQQFSGADDSIAFYDFLRFPNVLADERSNRLGEEALEYLYTARNNDAHGEGPKGFEVEKAYRAAREHLNNLLRAAEFVTEYPLIYIEKTRRDTRTNTTSYDYRELLGDHHLVPIHQGAGHKDCELEAESLYVIDRDGDLHLLRPILLYHPASRADRSATFYLNRYGPDEDICEMRSLEMGDTVELENVSDQFFTSGLIQLR